MRNRDKLREKGFDQSDNATPIAVFSTTLMADIQVATSNGHEDECEELVCRLLASGMPIEEISIVLNLRKREVYMIQKNNAGNNIPDYAKILKQRRERRLKKDKQRMSKICLMQPWLFY